MTNEIIHHTSTDVQRQGLDILSPLASKALFWRARYVQESESLGHVPFLFWLTEVTRPRCCVTLGLTDPVPHFSICQALEKLGLEALAYATGDTEVLQTVLDYNEQNYDDFSFILQPETESLVFDGKKVDLLIINQTVTQAVLDTLEERWFSQLSDRAVVVFLQGGDATGYAAAIKRLARDGSSFTLDVATQACLVLPQHGHQDRLQRLTSLTPGDPGYLAVRGVFKRLGEVLTNHSRLEKKIRESSIARRQRDEKNAEISILSKKITTYEAELESTKKQLTEHASLIAGAQAEAFDLRQNSQEQSAELEKIRTALGTAQDSLESSQKQRATLSETLDAARTRISELENRLREQDRDKAALAQHLKESETKCQGYTADKKRLTAQFAQAQAQSKQLESQIRQHTQDLQERYVDIATLGLELETQAATLSTLTSERDALMAEQGLLADRLAEAQMQTSVAKAEQAKLRLLASQQEESLGERFTDIATLGLELENLGKERDEAQAQVAAQAAEIEELKRRLHDSEQDRNWQADRVHALEDSTSWRVTAPLRRVSASLKRS